MAHRKLVIERFMSEIIDYTSCEHDHDSPDGSNNPHHDESKQPYFTSEDKFLEYIRDHTYPNRHLLHKHHATLDKITDIFVSMYTLLPVKIYRYDKATGLTTTETSALHQNIEVCPVQVFLLSFFLLLLTSAQILQLVELDPTNLRFHCHISSNIPIGSGLGSSASVVTSMNSGFYHISRNFHTFMQGDEVNYKLTDADRRVINTWAFQGERLIHGTPSGVDNSCCVYGGVVEFRRVDGECVMAFLPAGAIPSSIQVLISNTHQPKSTKALVQGVGNLKRKYPSVIQPIFDSIESIAQTQLTTLRNYVDRESTFLTEEEVFETFRDTIHLNQQLLNALGVGHARIDQVVNISNQFEDDFATKLTGAGGGGCVITLTNPKVTEEKIQLFSDAVKAVQMDLLRTVMGQSGALVEPLV